MLRNKKNKRYFKSKKMKWLKRDIPSINGVYHLGPENKYFLTESSLEHIIKGDFSQRTEENGNEVIIENILKGGLHTYDAWIDFKKDNNKLVINILNGGEFADTHTTTKTIDLDYYDPLDPDVLTTMWNKGRHNFYVVSPPERPVTANTKFQIIGGDYTLTTGNNRVFVDNFYVYRLDDVYYYLLDE